MGIELVDEQEEPVAFRVAVGAVDLASQPVDRGAHRARSGKVALVLEVRAGDVVAAPPRRRLRRERRCTDPRRVGRSYVISGMKNYMGALSQRLISRRMVTRIVGKMFRPMPGETK